MLVLEKLKLKQDFGQFFKFVALLRAKMGTKIVKKVSSKLNWRLHFANIRILNSVPFQFSPVRDLHQPNKTLRCELTEYSVSTWYCFIYHAVLQSRTADVITAPTVSNLVIIYTLESVLFVRAKHTHTFCTSNLNNDSFTFRDQKDNRSVSVFGLQDDFGTKWYLVSGNRKVLPWKLK